MKELFDEFPAVDKARWIAQVEKDLKGKPLSDLHWQLGEGIELAPFYHPEDLPEPPPPLLAGRTGNDWAIGEYLNVEEPALANEALMEGLKGGVEAPLFRLFHPLSAQGLSDLLRGVSGEMVALNFGEYYTGKQPQELFQQLLAWYRQTGVPPAAARASIDFDPLLDWSDPPMALLAELMRECSQNWPGIRPLQVNAKAFHRGAEHTVEELALTIAKGNEYLARLSELGIAPETANRHTQFGIALSKSYFVEIAKLRALRLLWANVLKGYGLAGQQPFIVAHFAHETQDEQPNTNIIRASTQAMSAAIGGADRLYVLPSDHALGGQYTAFSRRIARNLQHLLKIESHLHRVVDPGAGSYYIEELTRVFAVKAWARFQALDGEGAFKN